jgi:hypothetical protein
VCTLVVACRMWPNIPLLVAANRDENSERPSGRPRAWKDRPLPVFAPEDLQASGTWLGINASGLFVGITNRFGATPPCPGRRSRGLLVLDALEESNAVDAATRIVALPGEAHNRFHLLMADANDARLVWSDGVRLSSAVLGRGLHLLTERSLSAGPTTREALIKRRLEDFGESPPGNDALAELLSIHADDPFDGTCVHAPGLHYETRSSTIIRLWDNPLKIEFLHADGPPCRTSYEDLTSAAAAALSGTGRSAS